MYHFVVQHHLEAAEVVVAMVFIIFYQLLVHLFCLVTERVERVVCIEKQGGRGFPWHQAVPAICYPRRVRKYASDSVWLIVMSELKSIPRERCSKVDGHNQKGAWTRVLICKMHKRYITYVSFGKRELLNKLKVYFSSNCMQDSYILALFSLSVLKHSLNGYQFM